jgi:ribonuclease P/MRP protein subunit RPP40
MATRWVDVLYLDFSKAFDRVPKRRLISQLQHLGITGNLLAWINAFLSERTFCIRVGESYSRPVRVHSEVPQGSVLGPLLFIAYKYCRPWIHIEIAFCNIC